MNPFQRPALLVQDQSMVKAFNEDGRFLFQKQTLFQAKWWATHRGYFAVSPFSRVGRMIHDKVRGCF